MKFGLSLLLTVFYLCVVPQESVRGQENDLEIWAGTLVVQKTKLLLEAHVRVDENGDYSGKMISVDQGNASAKLAEFKVADGKLIFEVPKWLAKFEGSLNEQGTEAVGIFTQTQRKMNISFKQVPPRKSVQKHIETWSGTLVAGPRKFRFQIRVFENDDNSLEGKLDSFDESVSGLRMNLTIARDTKKFEFEIPVSSAEYVGVMSDDGMNVTGTWKQNGIELPLKFEKVELPKTEAVEAKVRPQTPKAPFDYQSEDFVIESTKTDGVELAGTLTMPQGDGPFPVTILISGSGPQDRDETIMDHKLFFVIADHFAKNGMAVLRFDERGVGESKGVFGTANTEDFAEDVEDLMNWVGQHAKIDAQKIALAGHSEGGIIAPMIASRRDDVAAIVMLAGTGVTGKQIVIDQTRRIATASGATKIAVEMQEKMLKSVFEESEQETDAPEESEGDEKTKTSPQIAAAKAQFKTPWFQFFLNYDPAPALEKVDCPVLVMIGENDLQVSVELNLEPIKNALGPQRNPATEYVILPKLNHLFQTSKTGAPSEYNLIEETIAPIALETLTKWTRKQLIRSK